MIKFFKKLVSKSPLPEPQTFDELLEQIIKRSNLADLNEFKNDPDESGAHLHHGPGTAMRNNLGLWEKTGPINEWFRKHGIWHGDDKSALIYLALHRKLNNRPFDIVEEAKFYKLYWLVTGNMAFDGEPANLTPNERSQAEADFEKEEARRDSRRPKRRYRFARWQDVIERDLPPAGTGIGGT